MSRILFEIGPITIYSYGLFIASGFLLSSVLILSDSEKFGLSRESVFDCLIAILLGGIIGGRLLFVAINWKHYLEYPLRIFILTEGGMAFHGALAGAVLSGAVAARIKNLPFLKTADIISPYIALGHAIGRIGCFLNGCCYGKVIIGGVGITYPGELAMRFPVQVYSSLFLLILYMILIEVRQRRRFDGQVFSAYIVLYAALRFVMEFFRGDNPAVFLGMTLAQVISAVLFFCGVVMYAALKRKGTYGLRTWRS